LSAEHQQAGSLKIIKFHTHISFVGGKIPYIIDVRNRKTVLDDQGGAGSNTGKETALEKGKKWARGDGEVKRT
jgi:hypothetical protein